MFQAQRSNKVTEQAAKKALEESKRLAIDKSEALQRAEDRRLQVERANKMLYDSTDRVKSFHSALLLSDVLREREKQIEYKELRETLKAKRDAVHDREQIIARELAEQAEGIKMNERKQAAYTQRDAQIQQLGQVKSDLMKKKEAAMIESELIKRAALDGQLQAKTKEASRRVAAIKANHATAFANEALDVYKAKQRDEEFELNKKIELFALQKRRMNEARVAREDAKRKEAQRRRDKMVAVMEADLASRRATMRRYATKGAEDKAAADDAKERINREEREELLRTIERSRMQQLMIREAEKARAAEEAASFVHQWKIRNDQLQQEDEKDKIEAFARAKMLQSAHLTQIDRKVRQAMAAREREFSDFQNTKRVTMEDEDLFQHYTNACMHEWTCQEKDATPMLIELAKLRYKLS